MKNILKYICFICLFIYLFPISVFGASTYYILESGVCFDQNANGNSRNYAIVNKDVRVICLGNSGGINGRVYYVCDESFKRSSSSSACPTSATSNASVRQNYYYFSFPVTDISVLNDEIPVIYVDNVSSTDTAIYYTYGEGSLGPVPEPINWGILKNVSYDTRIAGNGTASNHNIDYINWDNLLDANGNDISECTVEIQVVPGGWTGADKQTLLAQKLQDFTHSSYNPVTLASVDASVGRFSISWQGVVNELGWGFDDLYAKFENEIWRLNGWYYQVRLLAPDGYIGSWQTVYTPLSTSAAGSQVTVNSNEYNQSLYNYLTEISQVNNQSTINLNINNYEYNIQNPDNIYTPVPSSSPEPSEGFDDTNILNAIRNGVSNILNALGHLPESIVSGFNDTLVNLTEFSYVDNLPDDEELNTQIGKITENTYVGDLIRALYDIQTAFESHRGEVTTASSGVVNIPELAFDWENQHIVFVQEQSFNLYTWVQSDEKLAQAYDIYLSIVDGIIFISLIRMLYRRLVVSLQNR